MKDITDLSEDEERWMTICGVIIGAYIAYKSGSDPEKCLTTIFDALSRIAGIDLDG